MNSSTIISDVEFNHNLNVVRYTSAIFSKIVDFNDKVIDGFKMLKKEGINVSDSYFEYVDKLNNLAYKHLCVQTREEYNKILGAIGAGDILVNRGILDKNLETLGQGLYNLGYLLNELNVFDVEL